MNVLLLSMPDSFEHMPAAGVRMPNGTLSSLAGNVDPIIGSPSQISFWCKGMYAGRSLN